MSERPIDNRATIAPAAQLVPVRGPSGRLYGMLDPHTLIMEFRHGRQVERIALTDYQQTPTADTKANGS